MLSNISAVTSPPSPQTFFYQSRSKHLNNNWKEFVFRAFICFGVVFFVHLLCSFFSPDDFRLLWSQFTTVFGVCLADGKVCRSPSFRPLERRLAVHWETALWSKRGRVWPQAWHCSGGSWGCFKWNLCWLRWRRKSTELCSEERNLQHKNPQCLEADAVAGSTCQPCCTNVPLGHGSFAHARLSAVPRVGKGRAQDAFQLSWCL